MWQLWNIEDKGSKKGKKKIAGFESFPDDDSSDDDSSDEEVDDSFDSDEGEEENDGEEEEEEDASNKNPRSKAYPVAPSTPHEGKPGDD